jgi:hypothetical protein
MDLSRIVELQAMPASRLRLRFSDGADGIVDLAPLTARGPVFASLATATVRLSDDGRSIAWLDPDGDEADMDADTLRQMLAPARAAAE